MSILSWLKSIALVSLVVFLGFGSYLLWETARAEKDIIAQCDTVITAANAAIANVNTATNQIGTAFTQAANSVSQTESDVRSVTVPFQGVAFGLQKTVTLVNAPCTPGPCGTLSDAAKTMNTARLTMGQVEIAANDFNKNEAHFYQQEDHLYADSDDAVKSLDRLLSSPDLNAAIRNANTVTYNLGQSTTDFQTKFHDFLYPPPCKGFKCNVKKGYEIVHTASQFVAPAYWGWSLANGIK